MEGEPPEADRSPREMQLRVHHALLYLGGAAATYNTTIRTNRVSSFPSRGYLSAVPYFNDAQPLQVGNPFFFEIKDRGIGPWIGGRFAPALSPSRFSSNR